MAKSEGRDSTGHDNGTKLALYRKYRPTSLDQVIGQPQVTEVLAAEARTNSFAHAYLFTGQRGTGKTTVARILAHLINGLDYNDNINSDNIDIIEIDAASNNGVDDVREIRDSVQLAPMNCSHKVYIIDEFHMLSKPAFNALLKTIEEPPEYVVFILATTELQKVPATILSRVQRFHFKPLPPELLAKHLRFIADSEKIKADDDALLMIAQRGGGSVRDSITLLDQLSSNEHITASVVDEVLGLVSQQLIGNLIDDATSGNFQNIVTTVGQIIGDGTSPTALAEQLIQALQTRARTLNQPFLYRLIDQLLDVAKSSLPEAKLLSVLIGYACASQPARQSAPPSVSSSAPARNIRDSAPATKKAVGNSAAMTDEVTESKTVENAGETVGVANIADTTADTVDTTDTAVRAVSAEPALDNDPMLEQNGDSAIELNWEDVLRQLSDKDRLSTRSILNNCDYRYDPTANKLTLFFGKAFYRKQAKTTGFITALSTTLDELYHTTPSIEVSDEAAPADSDVAAVLKLVGGEVTTITNDTI